MFNWNREEEKKEIIKKKKKKEKKWMLIELFNAITYNKNLDEILKTYTPTTSDVLQLTRHLTFSKDFRIYGGLLNDWILSKNIEPATFLKILEKMLPEKKYYIKSSRDKEDKDFLKDIEIIKNYFNINSKEAEDYLHLLKISNEYSNFFELFKYGKIEE